jgi:hypothetical protein
VSFIRALDCFAAGDADDKDMQEIYTFCKNVAATHLVFLDTYASPGASVRRSLRDIHDEASMCITRLFLPRKPGEQPQLALIWRSISSESGKDHESARKHLVNLIRTVVWQQRIEALRRKHPQEWRVRRSLKLHISRSERFRMVRWCGELLVVRIADKPARWQPVSESVLREHCFSTFSGSDSPDRLLAKAMRILDQPEAPGNAVRFNDLAVTAIEYISTIYSSTDVQPAPPRHEEEKIVKAIAERVMTRVRNKINQTYVGTGKLSKERADAYTGALEHFLRDLLISGSTDTQYSYLASFLDHLEQDEFRRDHKAMFGYLVSEMRRILQQEVDAVCHIS